MVVVVAAMRVAVAAWKHLALAIVGSGSSMRRHHAPTHQIMPWPDSQFLPSHVAFGWHMHSPVERVMVPHGFSQKPSGISGDLSGARPAKATLTTLARSMTAPTLITTSSSPVWSRWNSRWPGDPLKMVDSSVRTSKCSKRWLFPTGNRREASSRRQHCSSGPFRAAGRHASRAMAAVPSRNYNNSLNPAWTAYVGSGASTGKVENKFIAQVHRLNHARRAVHLLVILGPAGSEVYAVLEGPRPRLRGLPATTLTRTHIHTHTRARSRASHIRRPPAPSARLTASALSARFLSSGAGRGEAHRLWRQGPQ